MGVSKNRGTPKSSVSLLNHPFWGTTIFWKHPNSDDDFPTLNEVFFSAGRARKGTILTSRKYLRHVSNEQILVELSYIRE